MGTHYTSIHTLRIQYSHHLATTACARISRISASHRRLCRRTRPHTTALSSAQLEASRHTAGTHASVALGSITLLQRLSRSHLPGPCGRGPKRVTLWSLKCLCAPSRWSLSPQNTQRGRYGGEVCIGMAKIKSVNKLFTGRNSWRFCMLREGQGGTGGSSGSQRRLIERAPA